MSEPDRTSHFSLIRSFSVADLLTLANGFGGMASILSSCQFLATQEKSALWTAFGALPFSAVCDYLDGRVARWRHRSSALGADLDSLADLISFGVAPAVLGFTLGFRGGWDAAVLLYFVGCGLSRLARYNVTAGALADEKGKVRYFEGTPIPTSLGLVTVLLVLVIRGAAFEALPLGVLALGPWNFHPLVLMFALSGSAMISKTLRIPKI